MSLGILKQVVQNAARMPGQRSIIRVSPGFIMPGLEYEISTNSSIVPFARKS